MCAVVGEVGEARHGQGELTPRQLGLGGGAVGGELGLGLRCCRGRVVPRLGAGKAAADRRLWIVPPAHDRKVPE